MAQFPRALSALALAGIMLFGAGGALLAQGAGSGGLALGQVVSLATPSDPSGLGPVVAAPSDVSASGNACIFPPKNTLGFTCSGPNVYTWKWDTEGAFDIEVDMGELANFDKVAGSQKYKLDLINLNTVAWYWYDANGAYNPVTDPNCSDGGRYLCDDPALAPEPFDIFKLSVNGQLIATQQGHEEVILGESYRYFSLKPIGNDPPGTYRIPESVLHDGINTVTIEPIDSYPQYDQNKHMPYHSQAADGWEVIVPAVQIQLVAPPLFISHGWAVNWNEAVGPADWQQPLANAIRQKTGEHLAQDPWEWASDLGDARAGMFLNFYDGKQNWRFSALDLRNKVNAYTQELGYSGKVWLTGHSMGGIVSRSYAEEFGGASKVSHIATFDTPHMGSPFADFYTRASWNAYKGLDGKLTAEYSGLNIGTPVVSVGPFGFRSTPLASFLYWRDWWNPTIGAYAYQYSGVGRDHLADFGIKPSGVNQVFTDPDFGFVIHTMTSNKMLDELNARYPASGVKYFAVVGITGGFAGTSLQYILQTIGMTGYFRGDAIVPDFSENLNGAIPSREVQGVTHLDVMKNDEAITYVTRSLYDLDLDTGEDPNAPMIAGAAPVPPELAPTTIAPSASSFETTEGDLVFVSRADLVEGAWDQPVTIDATVAHANFTVWTRADAGPLEVTLIDPDGVEHTKAVGVADRAFMYGESHDLPAKIRTYYVVAPAPGEWTIRARPLDDVPTEGLAIYATAFIDSPVSLVAGAGATRYHAGEAAKLRAALLDDDDRVAGASVVATFVNETGALQEVALLDDGAHDDALAGDGLYAASFDAPAAEGELIVRVEATGGSGAGAFHRVKSIPIFIASLPDLAILPGDLAAGPAEAWAGDLVTASVTLRNLGERASQGAMVLLEDDGALLASATLDAPLDVGATRAFTLEFEAPLHPVALTARVVSLDVDADAANDVTTIALGNVPVGRTVATIDGPVGDGDWLTGAATVTLAPIAGELPPGGAIFASLDGAPFVTYDAPLVIAAEGRHAVSYYATDGLGHTETLRTTELGVDPSAPSATLATPARGSFSALVISADNTLGYTFVAGPIRLDVRANDATSGLARLDVLVDGVVFATTTQAGAEGFEYLWDSTTASLGNHVLTVRVTNGAGLSTSASQHVYVLASRTVEADHDAGALVARVRPEAG